MTVAPEVAYRDNPHEQISIIRSIYDQYPLSNLIVYKVFALFSICSDLGHHHILFQGEEKFYWMRS